MASGDGDCQNIVESVQLFLDNIVDQVVRAATENEENSQFANQIIDNLINDVYRVVEEKELTGSQKDATEDTDTSQDKPGTSDGGRVTKHSDEDNTEKRATSVVKADASDTESVIDSRCIVNQQSVKSHCQMVEAGDLTRLKPRCRSLMLEFMQYDTKHHDIINDEQSNADSAWKRGRGEYDVISGKNMTCSWRVNSLSEASEIADRLNGFSNKYGQKKNQSISDLQSAYSESIHIEKTDANIRVKADELTGKVFVSFSKLKKAKTRHGKVTVHYTDDLSEEEHKRILKEADELLKNVKEQAKPVKKENESADSRGSGTGARVRRFFRNISCCRSSVD